MLYSVAFTSNIYEQDAFPKTDWQDAMEKFLYMEAAPRLELKAMSPISAAPKVNVSASGGDQRPQRLPGLH